MKKFLLTLILLILLILYIVFRGIINLYLPWNNYIAKNVAQHYVKDNISKNMELINDVKKNYKEGFYSVIFYSEYNKLTFEVLVDSKKFVVFKDNFKQNLFNKIICENTDDYFRKIFGYKGRYELKFITSDFYDLDKDYRNIEIGELNRYCKNINLYIHISYLEDMEIVENESKVFKLLNYMNKQNLNIDKIFIEYYSSPLSNPDYSYEFKM